MEKLNTLANNEERNLEQTVNRKKAWSPPEVIVIDSGNIQSGVDAGVNEAVSVGSLVHYQHYS